MVTFAGSVQVSGVPPKADQDSVFTYMKLHSFRQDLQDHQDLLDLILLYPVHPVDPARKWKFMPLSFLFD